MVRPLESGRKVEERVTSLQPTYEDSVEPEPDDEGTWEDES